MTEENYPGVFDRVKAMSIDEIVIIIFIIAIAHVFSLLESVPDYARIIAFVFVVLLYEPLFTSLFGGTIGHMSIGIRVKRESNKQKNILFPLAILRFIVKACIGIISLFTVFRNEKRKAIHDYLVGSLVIYAKSSKIENEC